jgi:hypothetical protein
MFLVHESHERRANQIRGWLSRAPSVALLVAAVYFEWTVSRALVALSNRANKDVRKALEKVYGLGGYDRFWHSELAHLPHPQPLSLVVRDWAAVKQAFGARNQLVHGKDRYTRNMARPEVDALLGATEDVMTHCRNHGVEINKRLRIRKTARSRTISSALLVGTASSAGPSAARKRSN